MESASALRRVMTFEGVDIDELSTFKKELLAIQNVVSSWPTKAKPGEFASRLQRFNDQLFGDVELLSSAVKELLTAVTSHLARSEHDIWPYGRVRIQFALIVDQYVVFKDLIESSGGLAKKRRVEDNSESVVDMAASQNPYAESPNIVVDAIGDPDDPQSLCVLVRPCASCASFACADRAADCMLGRTR